MGVRGPNIVLHVLTVYHSGSVGCLLLAKLSCPDYPHLAFFSLSLLMRGSGVGY